jgi:threonine dehydrogenase-like Zn-dependent dehydrogenase
LKTRALWYVGERQAELRLHKLSAVEPDQVRVASLYSALSRGTESLVWRQQVPRALAQEMRAPFQEGEFGAQVKYGYCSVGRVLALGSEVSSLELGQVVFCLHPHQDIYQVPATALTVVPDGVPARRAVLAANLETALNAVWDAAPGPGDQITVVGAGVVGSLVAWLCAQIPASRVQLVDLNADKAALAQALGAEFCLPGQAAGRQDLVIHASTSQAGLALSLELAGTEAQIVELSWYGDQSPAVPLGRAFHSRRLSLKSSQVGRIPPNRAPRWDYARRLQTVMTLLQAPVLDRLLEPEISLADLPAALPALLGAPGAMCQLVCYPQNEGNS